MKLMTILKLYALMMIALLAIATGCDSNSDSPQQDSNSSKPASEFNIIEVNAYEFMFNDNDLGGVIIFGSPEFKQCSLSFIQARFKPGYSVRTETFGEADIDLTCLSDKGHFAMSPIAPTFIDMAVTELNDNRAVVKLSFALFSARSKVELKRDNVELVIEGENLRKLNKTP